MIINYMTLIAIAVFQDISNRYKVFNVYIENISLACPDICERM